MSEPRRIKCDFPDRVESGAVEFEYTNGRIDWPGLFLRGDDSAHLAMQLDHALESLKGVPEMALVRMEIKGIRDMIWGGVIVGGWKKEGETNGS